jgi:hypothetical protein
MVEGTKAAEAFFARLLPRRRFCFRPASAPQLIRQKTIWAHDSFLLLPPQCRFAKGISVCLRVRIAHLFLTLHSRNLLHSRQNRRPEFAHPAMMDAQLRRPARRRSTIFSRDMEDFPSGKCC